MQGKELVLKALQDKAVRYIFGYTAANDVTARDLQRRDGSFGRAKGFDTFCPLGPAIETELDPAGLSITCAVNGEIRQDGTTDQMIFDVPTLVSYLSRVMTLAAGDLIFTGTPAGVGAAAVAASRGVVDPVEHGVEVEVVARAGFDLDHLAGRMIEEMGVDRHMEEILRAPDQARMPDADFRDFLKERGYSDRQREPIIKGEADLVILTGPHLGDFNSTISLPELTLATETVAGLCMAGRFCREHHRPPPVTRDDRRLRRVA